MLRLALIVLALGLVGVALAGYIPGALRSPAASPAVRAPVQPTPTPASVAAPLPTASGTLETRVASFVRTVEAGQTASIVVAEQEAAAVVRTALAQRGEERVQNLALRFVNGQVEATATLATPVGSLPVVAVLRPAVASDGTVDVRVEQVRVAGAAPPLVEGVARSFVEEQLARSLSQPEWLAISRLDVANGQLRLDAARR